MGSELSLLENAQKNMEYQINIKNSLFNNYNVLSHDYITNKKSEKNIAYNNYILASKKVELAIAYYNLLELKLDLKYAWAEYAAEGINRKLCKELAEKDPTLENKLRYQNAAKALREANSHAISISFKYNEAIKLYKKLKINFS